MDYAVNTYGQDQKSTDQPCNSKSIAVIDPGYMKDIFKKKPSQINDEDYKEDI